MSSGDRDLGPDPGAAAYRELDICALADAAVVSKAKGVKAPVVSEASSPSECVYSDDSGSFARLGIAAPRDQLPAEVRTTTPGTSEVQSTADGTILAEPGCTSAFLLAKAGYILRATSNGGTAGNCAMIQEISRLALRGLAAGPPTVQATAGELRTRDLCADIAATGGAGTGLEFRATTTDNRLCAASSVVWIGESNRTSLGSNEVEKATIGSTVLC